MIEIGKFYTLKRDVNTVAYMMSDHYNTKKRTNSEMITMEELEMPFMVLEQHDSQKEDGFWVQIMLNNKIGWINIDSYQLRKYITYSG